MQMSSSTTVLVVALLACAGCHEEPPPAPDAGWSESDDASVSEDASWGARDAALDRAETGDGAAADLPDAAHDTFADCPTLGAKPCAAAPGCFAIVGVSLDSICRGELTPEFAGCVSGGPDGGPAVTWGVSGGRILRFSSTQLPAGWTRLSTAQCAHDAGAD